jgi:hypothetical protein
VTVGFSKPRDPRAIPEHTLWTLQKGDRRAEARTRMTPGGPELRFYVTRTDGTFDLLWSQILDGREVARLSEEKRAEFEALGWAPPA